MKKVLFLILFSGCASVPVTPKAHLVRWSNTRENVPWFTMDADLKTNSNFSIQIGYRDDGVVVWRNRK